MRVAYFDCFSGISGAMALGALVHAGADLEHIAEVVGGLLSAGFEVEQEEVETGGIAALKVHVRPRVDGVIRTYASIRATLDEADLSDRVRLTSHRAFRLLAEADARAHGREVDLVTFHDQGDIDPIVGIMGTALALEELGVDRVFASPIPTGLGMARTEHGMVPIPSPVVATLLQGAPTYSRGIPAELVTPVGAALVAALAEGYGDMPLMRSERIGYGAGSLRLDFPHVLRVVIGSEEPAAGAAEHPAHDVLVLARTAIEPGDIRALLEQLMAAGAGDAWAVVAVGPGDRAGSLVHAVAAPDALEDVLATLRPSAEKVQILPLALPT
jgi:uncharacterized protein (TIGR00299 family) protein